MVSPPDAPRVRAPRRRTIARRLLDLAATQWIRLAIGTFALFAGSGVSLLYPQIVRRLFDGGASGRPGGVSPGLSPGDVSTVAALVVLHAVLIAARHVFFTTAGEHVVATLRKRLYAAVLTREMGFFDAGRTGDVVSRLVSDTSAVQHAVTVNVSMALRNAVTVVGGIALLFYTSPSLTARMLLVVPPVAIGAFAYGRRLLRLSREAHAALAESTAVAHEALAAIRTVRAFAAEPLESRRYGAALDDATRVACRGARTAGAFMGVASLASLGAAALVLLSGAQAVARGEMTAGGLGAFVVYTLMIALALGGLSDLWAEFAKARGAAERVFDWIDRAPRASGGARLPAIEGDVRFEGVRFSYPARPNARALDRVDLHVRPGEVVALVGPSGAGKSTIAALLLRLYEPDAGRILLDGRDVAELDPSWLRGRIGHVAQEPTLFSGTIAENILYGRPGAPPEDVVLAARAANAHAFITALPDGYATAVGERGVQLSGGQRQRIAIARALLKDPRLLILDEATSALDAESERLVRQALERLMRGRSTLIIAHRLSTIAGADAVVVVDRGRIVQRGSHRALLAEGGPYRRLVESQCVDFGLFSQQLVNHLEP